MKTEGAIAALVMTCSLALSSTTPPASACMNAGQAVRSMKLLTTNVGWAATKFHLYWTVYDGSKWRDITPPAKRRTLVVSVFFLNTRRGWALLAAPSWQAGETRLSLASTINSGSNWSIRRVVMPKLFSGTLFVPAGSIAFADSLHGCMNLGIQSSSNFNFGGLLITSDGGRSWQIPQSDPGVAGSVGFATVQEGWMVGGPSDLQFYMTHDGAKSWQKISLPAPAGIYSTADLTRIYTASKPVYGPPTFINPEDGFVTATYLGSSPVKSVAVLFKTVDGGKNWKAQKILVDLPEGSVGMSVSSSIADSTWLIAKTRRGKSPTLFKLSKSGEINAGTMGLGCATDMGCLANSRLSFVTPTIGWLIPAGGGPLLSTTNGGATWKNITPGSRPRSALRPNRTVTPTAFRRTATQFR